MYVHIVASALVGWAPFYRPEEADWFWRTLRASFPDALAACLMWNHLHLVAPEAPDLRAKVGSLLSGFTRHVGRHALFNPAPPPQRLPNEQHVRRTVRYIHLNPCREGAVSDPISWPWSTHRGAIGAELDPWVRSQHLRIELRWHARDFARSFHRYVSGDPSVKVEATPFPEPALPRIDPVVPLPAILRAARAATPWSPPALTRRIAHQLVREQGWADGPEIARVLGVSRRTLRRWTEAPQPLELGSAQMCLGDHRLTSRPETLAPSPRKKAKSMPPKCPKTGTFDPT